MRPTPTGVNEEQSLVRGRQQIISLLQRFRFVRQCIKCSAKNLVRIQEVFVKAQQAVVYPFSPLFDLSTGTLTKDCRKALTRIFRMYDQDHDGLLSNAELDNFQYQTFKFPLENRDVVGWKKVVARNTEEEVVRDGKFTVAGFLTIFDVFISQNRLDVPWKVLRKFGYSNELELTIIPMAETKKKQRLSTSSRSFLAALFTQFASSDNHDELSSDDLTEIFSIVPDPALPPWHPLRANTLLEGCFSLPSTTTTESSSSSSNPPILQNNPMELSVSASGITIASSAASSFPTVGDLNSSTSHQQQLLEPMNFMQWMGHWHMLATISPAAARAELFRLGHYSSEKRRKKTTAVVHMPSEEVVIYVLGSPKCGKTTLVNLLCGRNDNDNDTPPTPTASPETSTTHKVFQRRKEKSSHGEEEDVVVHFIITEVPRHAADMDQQQLAPLLLSKSPKPLVLFVFDSEKSFVDAKGLESKLLNDDIARVFMVTNNKDKDKENNYDAMMAEATTHCKELDLEEPFEVSLSSSSSQEDCNTMILQHLVQCSRVGDGSKKSRPHEEQKRCLRARRTKMMWLVVASVSVAAVAVGVFFGTSKTEQQQRKTSSGSGTSRFGWLTDMIFGRTSEGSAAAAAFVDSSS